MHRFLSAAVAAILVVSCLGQPGQASGGEEACEGTVPYIADTFDAFKFSFATGYHDMTSFRSLFVDKSNADEWILFDFENGLATYKLNGTCKQYQNDGLKLSEEAVSTGINVNFIQPDFAGVKGMGYTIEQSGVTIRGVIDMDNCVEIFTFLAVNGVPYTTLFRENIRTKNIDQEIRDNVDPILEYISTGNCQSTDLPY